MDITSIISGAIGLSHAHPHMMGRCDGQPTLSYKMEGKGWDKWNRWHFLSLIHIRNASPHILFRASWETLSCLYTVDRSHSS